MACLETKRHFWTPNATTTARIYLRLLSTQKITKPLVENEQVSQQQEKKEKKGMSKGKEQTLNTSNSKTMEITCTKWTSHISHLPGTKKPLSTQTRMLRWRRHRWRPTRRQDSMIDGCWCHHQGGCQMIDILWPWEVWVSLIFEFMHFGQIFR